MKTERYMRNPFFVDAVQVTEENFDEVAAWCQGEIRLKGTLPRQMGSEEAQERFIKVRVFRPMGEEQTMAFVGDWVLYAGTGYKVYKQPAFEKSFNKEKSAFVLGEEETRAKVIELVTKAQLAQEMATAVGMPDTALSAVGPLVDRILMLIAGETIEPTTVEQVKAHRTEQSLQQLKDHLSKPVPMDPYKRRRMPFQEKLQELDPGPFGNVNIYPAGPMKKDIDAGLLMTREEVFEKHGVHLSDEQVAGQLCKDNVIGGSVTQIQGTDGDVNVSGSSQD